MNNNIPDQQHQPQQTGVSINQSKTKTPVFQQQVPQSNNGGGSGSSSGSGGASINNGRYIPSINTNTSNIVQSTMNWPQSSLPNGNNNHYHQQPFNPSYATSPRPPTHYSANNNYNNNNSPSTSQTSLSNSHKPTKKTSKYLNLFISLYVSCRSLEPTKTFCSLYVVRSALSWSVYPTYKFKLSRCLLCP